MYRDADRRNPREQFLIERSKRVASVHDHYDPAQGGPRLEVPGD
jgi:hypothetical protein